MKHERNEPPGVALRVVAVNAARVDPMADIRALRPDLVVLRQAPWRLRWRTPIADLARSLGLFYAAGGGPAAGNAVLASMRVRVRGWHSVRYPLIRGRRQRGAVLVECSIGASRFLVAGTQLAGDPVERDAQAAILAAELALVGTPLVVAAEVGDDVGGPAWRLLAEGRAASGSPTGGAAVVFTGPGVRAHQVENRPDGRTLIADLIIDREPAREVPPAPD